MLTLYPWFALRECERFAGCPLTVTLMEDIPEVLGDRLYTKSISLLYIHFYGFTSIQDAGNRVILLDWLSVESVHTY
jgi:hypothetical protein